MNNLPLADSLPGPDARSVHAPCAPGGLHSIGTQRDSFAYFCLIAVALLFTEILASLLNAQSYKLSGVSLVWLPNGLLLGVLLCTPKNRWWRYLVLGYVIDLLVNLYLSSAVPVSAAFASLNSLEIIVAAFLIHKYVNPKADLTLANQLRAFLIFGVFLAPATAALGASTYLRFHDHVPFSQSWRFWFAADMLGIATITPLYLSFHHGRQFSVRPRFEVLVLFGLLLGITLTVFFYSTFPALWLVLMILILLGVRAGFTASALGLLLVISVGGYLTIIGRGPLGHLSGHTLANRMLFFQFFVALSMIGLYVTEVAMSANRSVQAGLVESERRYRSLADDLEDRVMLRTFELQQEISEREVVQNRLLEAKVLAEEANRAKSFFLANMSHELRTPLNAILGYSEMLQEDAIANGDQMAASDLERIQRAGRHLLSIINDVLDLSKIESGRMELHLQEASVADILLDVAATIKPLAAKQGNSFATKIEDMTTLVQVDIIKFRQCLLNLLSNACKFTEHGSVALEVACGGPADDFGTRWSIIDTGIGIDKENMKRLFQPFTQVDSSATRKHDGTGLGLVISQRLITEMGGTIALHSEIGKGSTFAIQLPRYTPSHLHEPEGTIDEMILSESREDLVV